MGLAHHCAAGAISLVRSTNLAAADAAISLTRSVNLAKTPSPSPRKSAGLCVWTEVHVYDNISCKTSSTSSDESGLSECSLMLNLSVPLPTQPIRSVVLHHRRITQPSLKFEHSGDAGAGQRTTVAYRLFEMRCAVAP